MKEGLPKGWTEVELKTVVYFQEGPGLRKWQFSGKGIPFLNINTLENERINKSKCKFVKEEEFENRYEHFLLDEGDIVVSSSGTLGKIAVIAREDLPVMLNTSIIRFRSLNDEILLQTFLKYFLKSNYYYSQIMKLKTGSAILNYGPSHLKKMNILLPPINEQQRIATRLDTIMPKIEAVNARLDRIQQIIKRFRQSVLTAAVTGKLTEQWREEHLGILGPKVDNTSTLYDISLPNSWEACTLGALSTYVTSGSRGWAKYYSEKGSIFIRAQNIKTDKLILDDVAFVQLPEKAEGRRTKIEKGDILITITGANVTKTALVRKSLEDAYVNQHVALVRLNEAILGLYLHLWLIAPNAGRRQLEDAAYGAGKPGLNLQNIKDVVVHLPPLEEQQEIVRQVDKFFAFADKLEAHYHNAKAKIEKLPQSVLAKAFRGELVPQDQSDEPAEKLLERIKAEKAQLEMKKKPNKRENTKKRKGRG